MTTAKTTAAAASRPKIGTYALIHDVLSVGIQSGVVPVLIGPPGTGKTAITEAVARALGRETLTLRLAQTERGDVTGFPVPYVDATTGAPRTSFLPGPLLQRAMALIDSGRLVHIPLEELPHADPSQQTAAMGLVYDRMAGEVRLPGRDRLTFSGTGNGASSATGGGSVGYSLTAALANRVAQIYVERPSAAEWRAAKRAGWPAPRVALVDPARLAEVRARTAATMDRFFDANPSLDYALPASDAAQSDPWPSHRSWDEGERAWTYAEALGLSAAADAILAGLVGAGPAAQLRTYWDEQTIPSVAQLLAGEPLPSRDDACRIALDTLVSAAGAAHKDSAPDAGTIVPGVVSILAAAANTRPHLTVPPASRLTRELGTAASVELTDLMRRLKPTIDRMSKRA